MSRRSDPEAQQQAEEQAAYDARSLQAVEAGQLPLRAQERLARMKGRAFTSALSVPSFATVHGVGFDPVGQVLGTCVYQLGWAYTNCGYWGYGNYGGGLGGGFAGGGYAGGNRGGGIFAGGGFNGGITGQGYGGPPAGTPTGISVADVDIRRRALRDASSRALSRLSAEAQGLGADGVVDVTLTWTPFGELRGALEVQAIGTAVRGRGQDLPHLGTPFLSDLSGQDVSLLLRSGYAPTGVAVGIAVCVRHDDYWTRQASSAWAGNTEIPGVTELISVTRHRAREAAAHDVASLGGTALVVKAMSLRTWEQEPGEGHRDHLAEASVVGTSVVPIGRRSAPPPIASFIRLNGDRINDPRRQSL